MLAFPIPPVVIPGSERRRPVMLLFAAAMIVSLKSESYTHFADNRSTDAWHVVSVRICATELAHLNFSIQRSSICDFVVEPYHRSWVVFIGAEVLRQGINLAPGKVVKVGNRLFPSFMIEA